MDKKIKALAKFLEIDESNIEVDDYGSLIVDCEWVDETGEYLVLTDDEADEKAKQEIIETLWAFKTEFILDCCGLDTPESVVASLQDMQEKCCEGCNAFIRALVDGTCGIDTFVNLAIESDGREHFIATYDDEENEQDEYFIYRVN